MKGKNILICVTGSIAAYRVCDLIPDLREKGTQVTCVMTKCAHEFVTPLSLSALSGRKVYSEMFGSYDGVVHTELADHSDLILVMPASANFIARLANGLADDLASCIILASRAPLMIVPAMNDVMYRNPITQENIKKLQGLGHRFVGPVKGRLACGREEMGHIAPPESILGEIDAVLSGPK